MTLDELITLKRTQLNRNIHLHNQYATELEELRAHNAPDPDQVERLRASRARVAAAIPTLQAELAQFEREAASDAEIDQRSQERHPVPGAPAILRGEPDVGADRSNGWINTDTGERASLRVDERFAGHPIVARHQAPGDEAAIAQYGNLAQMVRALTTSSGSAVVPAAWAADLIDRARNASAVMQAGATVVPMDAKTVNIGRLTGDPTATFRAEGSEITASDPVLDNVTLTAKTQSTLVVGSLEWFQDADNAEQIVSDAIAMAIALQIDLAALYGGITTGAGSINLATPPNPRGILAALNATLAGNVLGGATDGTTQTATAYWDEIIDTIFKVRDGNEEPNALIMNSKLARIYAKAYDTTGQPLRTPADVEGIKRFTSNQIPSYTKGTMTSVATDVFVGDFTQLLVGQRLGITLQVLTERYAEFGQIGIVAHWRGDIQPARSTAFAVYRALKGSA